MPSSEAQYRLYTATARIGDNSPQENITKYYKLEEAKKEFKDLFYSKTQNSWLVFIPLPPTPQPPPTPPRPPPTPPFLVTSSWIFFNVFIFYSFCNLKQKRDEFQKVKGCWNMMKKVYDVVIDEDTRKKGNTSII